MKKETSHWRTSPNRSGMQWKLAALGVATGVCALLWKMMQASPARRYADKDVERRNPNHFFLAGSFPRRREIDRSGRRPLFERRHSAYDVM